MKGNIIVGLGVCLLLVAGCGKNVRVTGKVTFEDGTPLSKGMVIFSAGATESKAPIGEDGSYVVGTLKSGDGIPRGTYRVYITGAAIIPGMDARGVPLGPVTLLADKKFSSPETSGLTCEVKGSMTYDITVTPPDK